MPEETRKAQSEDWRIFVRQITPWETTARAAVPRWAEAYLMSPKFRAQKSGFYEVTIRVFVFVLDLNTLIISSPSPT